MITIIGEDEIEQGSQEWHNLRNTHLSGTDAFKILKGIPPEEILKAKQSSTFSGNYYTRRGHILEDEMKKLYQTIHEEPIRNAGIILNDKFPLASYSPDGYKDDKTLIECKAFNPTRHINNSRTVEAPILAQIHYGLWLGEFERAILLLYNPDIEELENCYFEVPIKTEPILFQKFEEYFKKYGN